MPKVRTLVVASALGAAASYFFDPERGAGRVVAPGMRLSVE